MSSLSKPNRREFLRACAISPLVLGAVRSMEISASQLSTVKPIIILFASGGMSAKESFNPDTIGTPENLRGPLRSIQTEIPGINFSEVFPNLAQMNSKFALMRNLHAGSSDHITAAENAFLRGNVNVSEPIGERAANGGVPYAFLNPNRTWPAVQSAFHQSNSLSPPYRDGRFVPPTMAPVEGLSERRALLEAFEQGATIHSPVTERMRRFRETAFDLLQGGGRFMDAFNLPEGERDRYGRNLAGDGMLLARRLVERGAGAVTLYFEPTSVTFDLHSNLEAGMRQWAPMVDRASAAIVDDISQNRLDCVFLLTTEFNRGPMNSSAGRDHSMEGNQALLAGTRRGVVYSEQVDQRQLPATVLSAAGVEVPPNEPRIRL